MAKTKNADGTESGSNQGGARIVYVEKTSDPAVNRNLSTAVAPALYDAFVQRVGELKGTGAYEGKKILLDGSMAQAIRESIAAYAEYQYGAETGNLLVLTKSKESNKTVQARGVVKAMFAGLRQKLDFDTSVTVARGTLVMMQVSLTEQEFADLWDEAAA